MQLDLALSMQSGFFLKFDDRRAIRVRCPWSVLISRWRLTSALSRIRLHESRWRSRSALPITDTELRLMAAAAIMGLSSVPVRG